MTAIMTERRSRSRRDHAESIESASEASAAACTPPFGSRGAVKRGNRAPPRRRIDFRGQKFIRDRFEARARARKPFSLGGARSRDYVPSYGAVLTAEAGPVFNVAVNHTRRGRGNSLAYSLMRARAVGPKGNAFVDRARV